MDVVLQIPVWLGSLRGCTGTRIMKMLSDIEDVW
jgi:hypothetical protein